MPTPKFVSLASPSVGWRLGADAGLAVAVTGITPTSLHGIGSLPSHTQPCSDLRHARADEFDRNHHHHATRRILARGDRRLTPWICLIGITSRPNVALAT
jgi:hypothetical protein